MRGRGVNITTRLTFILTHTHRTPITRTLHIRTIDRIGITATDIITGLTRITTVIIRDTGIGDGN